MVVIAGMVVVMEWGSANLLLEVNMIAKIVVVLELNKGWFAGEHRNHYGRGGGDDSDCGE